MPTGFKKKLDYLRVDMESASSFCAVATQGTYSSYYSTSYKLRFFYRLGLTEFYKMDNNAKVNGQKLNELDAVKASFVQLLLFLWRDNDFEIYRDRFLVTFSRRPESLRDPVSLNT